MYISSAHLKYSMESKPLYTYLNMLIEMEPGKTAVHQS